MKLKQFLLDLTAWAMAFTIIGVAVFTWPIAYALKKLGLGKWVTKLAQFFWK